jgi:hypothetical protein
MITAETAINSRPWRSGRRRSGRSTGPAGAASPPLPVAARAMRRDTCSRIRSTSDDEDRVSGATRPPRAMLLATSPGQMADRLCRCQLPVSSFGQVPVLHLPPSQPAGVLMLPTAVRTVDASGFEDACASLMRLVQARYAPDLLIGIPTGGLAVAQAMGRAASGIPAVMPLTCRFLATEPTSRLPWLPTKLRGLPRSRADLPRNANGQRISAGCSRRLRRRRLPDKLESVAITSVVAAGAATRLLVVDDAVACGMSLRRRCMRPLSLSCSMIPRSSRTTSCIVK